MNVLLRDTEVETLESKHAYSVENMIASNSQTPIHCMNSAKIWKHKYLQTVLYLRQYRDKKQKRFLQSNNLSDTQTFARIMVIG